jgi:hypothetical protein
MTEEAGSTTQLLERELDDRDNVVRLPNSGCPSSGDPVHRSWCRHMLHLGVLDDAHDRLCLVR